MKKLVLMSSGERLNDHWSQWHVLKVWLLEIRNVFFLYISCCEILFYQLFYLTKFEGAIILKLWCRLMLFINTGIWLLGIVSFLLIMILCWCIRQLEKVVLIKLLSRCLFILVKWDFEIFLGRCSITTIFTSITSSLFYFLLSFLTDDLLFKLNSVITPLKLGLLILLLFTILIILVLFLLS
jgi:hypothetical protein